MALFNIEGFTCSSSATAFTVSFKPSFSVSTSLSTSIPSLTSLVSFDFCLDIND